MGLGTAIGIVSTYWAAVGIGHRHWDWNAAEFSWEAFLATGAARRGGTATAAKDTIRWQTLAR